MHLSLLSLLLCLSLYLLSPLSLSDLVGYACVYKCVLYFLSPPLSWRFLHVIPGLHPFRSMFPGDTQGLGIGGRVGARVVEALCCCYDIRY